MQGNDYDGSSGMQMVSRVNLALVLHNNFQRDFLILFHCAHYIEPILYSQKERYFQPKSCEEYG